MMSSFFEDLHKPRLEMLYYTHGTIKEYFISNTPNTGDELLIVDTGHDLNTFIITKVVHGSHGRQRRIITEHCSHYGGHSWYRSGKNCWSPTGQGVLLPPHKAVIEFIKSKGNTRLVIDSDKLKELIG